MSKTHFVANGNAQNFELGTPNKTWHNANNAGGVNIEKPAAINIMESPLNSFSFFSSTLR